MRNSSLENKPTLYTTEVGNAFPKNIFCKYFYNCLSTCNTIKILKILKLTAFLLQSQAGLFLCYYYYNTQEI